MKQRYVERRPDRDGRMENQMKREVVITGLGAVSPIGNTVKDMWQSVLDAKCGIAPITRYDVTERKVKLAAEVKDFDPELTIDRKEVRKMDRYTQYAMAAAVEACRDAGISEAADLTEDSWETRSRWGVLMASGIGGIRTIEEEQMRGESKGFDRVSPFFIPKSISNMAAGQIAIRYGFHGACYCTVTACASAANAIGEAFLKIRDGYADLMLCGGAEAAITPLSMGGFTSLQALSKATDPNRASIPFDKERSGFVMGEGAGVLILEELEHAKARGAQIYGKITGYGTNCDAHHITAPLEDGRGASACMQMALDDAGITAADVDYINAHGTSTPLNDCGETLAIRTTFGEHADKLKCSSTKSMTGHLLGASAAIEAIITVLAIQNQFLPPTVNYAVPDEDCDLDIVPGKGYEWPVHCAISNSLGFGGHNATLVFSE